MPMDPTPAATPSRDRRRAIGAFLRARREALSPADIGLHPTPGRRRAPGLRREEAAQTCGISTTWYTWLEQGRDVSCSAATLGRIATALHLSVAERRYLFDLARLQDPRAAPAGGPVVPDSVRRLPDLLAVPCYVLDPLWNACAANPAARRLFAGWLAGGQDNLLRYVFLSPGARDFLDDWQDSARRILAEFRADSLHGDPARTERLVADLRAHSREFDLLWHGQSVLARQGGPRRFHHPTDGTLDFDQTTLGFVTDPGYKLVTLVPIGAAPAPARQPAD